jgi:hypothetical protein
MKTKTIEAFAAEKDILTVSVFTRAWTFHVYPKVIYNYDHVYAHHRLWMEKKIVPKYVRDYLAKF